VISKEGVNVLDYEFENLQDAAMDYSIRSRRVINQFNKGLITESELNIRLLILAAANEATMDNLGQIAPEV
jgi:hypothetical protein